MRRSKIGAAAAVAAFLGLTAAAQAVTVGQLETPTVRGGVAASYVQTGVASGTSYAFPSDGVVTSFSTRAYKPAPAGAVAAVVYRRIGTTGTNYSVVAVSNPVQLPTTSGTVTTGTFPSGTAVKAGDVIGIRVPSDTEVLASSTSAVNDQITYFTAPYTPASQAGLTVSGYKMSLTVEETTGPPPATTCVQTVVRRNDPLALGKDTSDVRVTVPGGYDHIQNTQVTNGSVGAPTAPDGTTSPFTVTVTKGTQGQITRFSFDVVDKLGRVKHCQ